MTGAERQTIPIVCDMTTATDTIDERLADYQRLFAEALVGRERTVRGIRFRFAAEPGVEELVRDLAARERACCAFMFFDIAIERDEIVQDVTVVDDDTARGILDEYYRLPESGPSSRSMVAGFAGHASRRTSRGT